MPRFEFKPKTQLMYDSSYVIKIDSDVSDIYGNKFADGKPVFNTVNSNKIKPQMISPASGIDANHAVISMKLTNGSYEIDDFKLTDVKLIKESDGTPVDFTMDSRIDFGQYVYDIKPCNPLSASSRYKISVSGKFLRESYELLSDNFTFETAATRIVDVWMDSWNYDRVEGTATLVLVLNSKDQDLLNDTQYILNSFIVTEKYDISKVIPNEDIKASIVKDEDVPDYMRKYILVKLLISKAHLVRDRNYLVKTNGAVSSKNYQLDPKYEYWFVG